MLSWLAGCWRCTGLGLLQPMRREAVQTSSMACMMSGTERVFAEHSRHLPLWRPRRSPSRGEDAASTPRRARPSTVRGTMPP